MKLNKTTEYSLRILIYMAQKPSELYSAGTLVKELKVSDKYLRRIMTDLSKSGFIQSAQGRTGGYSFAKDPSQIFLLDIIDAVEGIDSFNGCVLGFESCSCINPCAMHETWLPVRNELNKVFSETKLSELDFEKILRF
jgi:Rrf2 family protein